MRHWSVGRQMARSGTGWGEALNDLASRLAEHAAGLRVVALGMTSLDQDLRDQFRGWGTV